MPGFKVSPTDILNQLPLPETEKWPEGVWDTLALQHGSMSLLLFAPRWKDYQSPHEQDELYFIIQGQGTLVVAGERIPFNRGDALFVPSGEEHRFEDIADDLITWAIFWGPPGGESRDA